MDTVNELDIKALRKLEAYPYAMNYNPDGYRGGAKFLVRLPGVGMESPDMKPLGETKDILGFGISLEEAAENVMRAAGLFRRSRYPKVHRTVDAHNRFSGLPVWNNRPTGGHA